MPPAPPPIDTIRLYHPEWYIERAIDILRRSNFVCWPESGGWAEQDELLVNDVMIYLALEAQMEWEARYQPDTADLIPIAPSGIAPLHMSKLGG